MPTVSWNLSQAKIDALTEAWGEDGVPLKQSVLRMIGRKTKAEIRRKREGQDSVDYQEAQEAARAAEDAQYDNWQED